MYDLGLTAAQFAELTPRHIQALNARRIDTERQRATLADRRVAMLACMYANVHRDHEKRPFAFTIEDFMPVQATPGQGASGGRRQTAEEQIEMLRMFTDAVNAMPRRAM